MTAVFNGRGIKLSVIARILRDEMAQRDNGIIGAENVCAASLADEVAASGKMTPNTAKRRIYSILNPEYTTRNGKRITQQVVEFDTADKILTALDLNYLWHTDAELADAVVEPPGRKELAEAAKPNFKQRVAQPCRGCGGSWDERTKGCRTCESRHCWRAKAARDKAAAAEGSSGPRRGGHANSPVSLPAAALPLTERKAA